MRWCESFPSADSGEDAQGMIPISSGSSVMAFWLLLCQCLV